MKENTGEIFVWKLHLCQISLKSICSLVIRTNLIEAIGLIAKWRRLIIPRNSVLDNYVFFHLPMKIPQYYLSQTITSCKVLLNSVICRVESSAQREYLDEGTKNKQQLDEIQYSESAGNKTRFHLNKILTLRRLREKLLRPNPTHCICLLLAW